jgi:hypothetical protein
MSTNAKVEPNTGSDVRNLIENELDNVTGAHQLPWQYWVPGPAVIKYAAPPYIHLFSPYTDVT